MAFRQNSMPSEPAEHYAWQTLIDQIKSVENEIYEALRNAFAEGEDNPQGAELIKRDAFESIWKGLNLDFETLENLDGFYRTQLANLEKNININLGQNFHNPEDLSTDKRQILRHIVQLRYYLAKQSFLAAQFKPSETPDQILISKEPIDNTYKMIESILDLLGVFFEGDQLGNLYEFKAIFSNINHRLKVSHCRHYLDLAKNRYDYAGVNLDKNKPIKIREWELISEALEKLQESEESEELADLAPAIKRYQVLRQLENAVNMLLKNYRQHISTIKELKNLHDSAARQVESSKRLLECWNRISMIRNGAETTFSSIDFTAFIELCKKQSSLERFSIGVFSKGWQSASKLIAEKMSAIQSDISKFLSSYDGINMDHYPDLINSLYARLQPIVNHAGEIDKVVSEAQQLWDSYPFPIRSNKIRVSSTKSSNQPVQSSAPVISSNAAPSLFARYWWKSLSGALLLGGIAALLVFLAIPIFTLPVAITILVGSTLAGGALAVCAGIAIDSCRDSCAVKNEEDANVPLSDLRINEAVGTVPSDSLVIDDDLFDARREDEPEGEAKSVLAFGLSLLPFTNLSSNAIISTETNEKGPSP